MFFLSSKFAWERHQNWETSQNVRGKLLKKGKIIIYYILCIRYMYIVFLFDLLFLSLPISNIATLQLRNSLFILRCVSHHVIQTRSEAELLLMFDPTPSAPAQDESSTSPLEFNSSESSNKVGAVNRSGLKILLHGIVMLLGEVPLV